MNTTLLMALIPVAIVLLIMLLTIFSAINEHVFEKKNVAAAIFLIGLLVVATLIGGFALLFFITG